MNGRIIRLCYRKVIDSGSPSAWDKLVFEDSYREFRMQVQYFDQEKKYGSFAALIHEVPAAEKLHFLVSAAVRPYLEQLNKKVPDILNNLGRHFLTFTDFMFEIINSDLRDIHHHQIAITFFTNELIWHDSIGEYLLLSETDNSLAVSNTDLIKIQPFLGIYSLRYE